MADFTPTVYEKAGAPDEVATSWSEHYRLVWEGYRPAGAAPPPPPTLTSRVQSLETLIEATIPAPLTSGDAQVVAWSETLGEWVAVNPSGESEMAYAANVTGTPTACSAASGLGTAVVVPGTAVSVGDSNGRPVVLQFGGVWQQTAVGDGAAYLMLFETTSGAVQKHQDIKRLPNSIGGAVQSLSAANQFRIGAVTTTRTFELRALLWAVAGASPSAQLLNATNNPSYLRTVAG